MDGGRVSRAALLATVSYLAVAVMAPRLALAEVRTDGTLGRRGLVPGGANVVIPAGLGQQRGGNLFHSFEKFDVQEGGSVTFKPPIDGTRVDNVISRITGGERSEILGRLASEIPDADLYLFNPAGILFGPNATLDVKGAFHASAAGELRLADGAVFSALDVGGSSLSVAEPKAFGFLGAHRGTITLSGGTLGVMPGKHLSLSAHEVELSGGVLQAGDRDAGDDLLQSGGRVTLAGIGEGALDLASGDVVGPVAGAVRLDLGATINAGGDGGGSIEVRAQDVTLRGGSQMLAHSLGDLDAEAGIDFRAERIDLSGSSIVAADVLSGTGRGGSVYVAASELAITQGAQIRSNTFSSGGAGLVTIAAENIMVAQGQADAFNTGIDSSSLGTATGNAGGVVLKAGDLSILDGGRIRSSTAAAGNAGNLDLQVTNTFLIDGRGSDFTTGIGSGVLRTSKGEGGSIQVKARSLRLVNGGEIGGSTQAAGDASPITITADSLLIDRSGAKLFTGIVSAAREFGTGDGGSIAIAAELVEVRRGGQIKGSTFSSGLGSAINITAERLIVDGSGTGLDTSIDSSAEAGTGRGGTVTVQASDVALLSGGQLRSYTISQGDAGGVTVAAARSLRIDQGSSSVFTGIDAGSFLKNQAQPQLSSGNGGNISVIVGDELNRNGVLEVTHGGLIRSTTRTAGNAGEITLQVRGQMRIDGEGSNKLTGIGNGAARGSGGNGGSVVVVADRLDIMDGSEIANSTTSAGRGGPISIEAGSLLIDRKSSDNFTGIVSAARSGSTGNAGNIGITSEHVELRNGGEIKGTTQAGGRGGTISLKAGRLLIDGAGTERRTQIDSNTEDGTGEGGAILVRADTVQLRNGGMISSTTRGAGAAGTIEVTTVSAQAGADAGPTLPETAYTGNVVLSDGAAITTGTEGPADAGQITVRTGELSLGGTGTQIASSSTGVGDAGTVIVDGADVLVRGAASISASTAGSGQGGTVTVTGARLALADQGSVSSGTTGSGAAGDITVAMSETVRLAGGTISTNGEANGGAGKVKVTAPLVAITGGSISSSATGSGAAGTVQVLTSGGGEAVAAAAAAAPTGRVDLSDGAAITTSTLGNGHAGSVTIRTGELSVVDGASRISSSTAGAGAAGGVRIEAGDSVTVDGATIESSSTGTGAGGDVSIDSPNAVVTLKGEGTLAASARAGSGAGNIDIAARELNAKDGIVSTEGGATAGGRITVAARERIYLRDTAITSSGAVAQGGASVISLTAPQLILSRSQVESLTGDGQTLAGSGEAELTGQITVISSDTIVAGSSSVVISGLQTNLGSDLQISPNVFLDADSLLMPSCAERGPARSTFSRGGRGGLPPAPDRPLPSAGAEPPAAVRAADGRPIFLDLCAGSLVPATKS